MTELEVFIEIVANDKLMRKMLNVQLLSVL
jgi:hypothetical protein